MSKKQIRAVLRQQRNALDSTRIKMHNDTIFQQMETLDIFTATTIIGCFYPFEQEVNIDTQLQKTGVKRAYPDFKQSQLRFYTDITETVITPFGVKKPVITNQKEVVPDILIIPVIAINIEGYRLGYGGGYYDRYLKAHPEIQTIALFYDTQKITERFQEKHDQKLDCGVSEAGIYYFK